MSKNKPSGRYRTGRYFMSQAQMAEAKWIESMINSQIKRGEATSDYWLFQCGCGCGAAWSFTKYNAYLTRGSDI